MEDIDKDFISVVMGAHGKAKKCMDDLRVADALDEVFEIFKRSNKYIDETMPWVLAKDESKKERLATVLYHLLEAIRHGAVLLQAFLPDTASSIFHQLNSLNQSYESLDRFDGLDIGIHLNAPEPLFLRIDKEKKLEELKG